MDSIQEEKSKAGALTPAWIWSGSIPFMLDSECLSPDDVLRCCKWFGARTGKEDCRGGTGRLVIAGAERRI